MGKKITDCCYIIIYTRGCKEQPTEELIWQHQYQMQHQLVV